MVDQIERFLDEVKEHIRWKQARKGLEMELRTHLLDQRDALMAQGMEECDAAAECVRQMGDPVEVGVLLDRVHRPKSQRWLLALVGIIICAGLILQSTVMQELRVQPYMPHVLASVMIGMALMLVIYFVGFQWLGRHPVPVYIIGLASLLGMLCYVTGRFSLTAEPVRFTAIYVGLLMPVFCYAPLVWYLRRSGWRGFALSVLAAIPMPAAALMLPSMTAALIDCAVCLTVLFDAVRVGWGKLPRRSSLLVLGLLLASSAVAGIVYARGSAYAMRGLELILHPEIDPLGRGYSAHQARLALAQAKMWGDCGHDIPFGNNDLWLTRVICRLGWTVGLILISLLAILFLGAARRCIRQRGPLGRMLSFSALTALAGESVLYILFNLGLQLSGPWVLPLLSTGGSYMVVNLLLVGLMLGVFRYEQLPEANTGKKLLPMPDLILWQDGDLVIRLSRWKRTEN